MTTKTNVLSFWGKASTTGTWHPVAHHGLDVAATVSALLTSIPRFQMLAERLSPLHPETTRALLLFFAAVHDVGKFAPGFQGKVPELAAMLGICHRQSDSIRHTDYGSMFWNKWLSTVATFPVTGHSFKRCLQPLAVAAFGHHGTPQINLDADTPARQLFASNWQYAATYVEHCARLFLPDDIPLPCGSSEYTLRHLSWFAAGLYILADWIGSDETFFPHSFDAEGITMPAGAHATATAHTDDASDATPSSEPATDEKAHWSQALPEAETASYEALADYYVAALSRADKALTQCGLLPSTPQPHPSFATLFPQLANVTPHPLQQAAETLPLAETPQLFILEDLTGGGKTEAALVLAARLMAAGHGEGVFIGLPTQATANAMYERLAQTEEQLFPEEHTPTMLAHGGSRLHDAFQARIKVGPHTSRQEDDCRNTSRPWLADNRKKALLASCGAGTIDQALLGVLPSRHQALRLLGLSRSILIADEVHAFDDYTNELLQALLTFYAAQGGSAIMLSATLPQSMRAGFVAAYQRGRALAAYNASSEGYCPEFDDLPAPSKLTCADFPLITQVVSATHVNEIPVPPSPRQLHVAVQPHHTPAPLLAALCAVHKAGGCGAWVRNTVDDAIEARRILVDEHDLPENDVLLFHARYAGCDRQRIEADALTLFGKHSTPETRRGKILIATQVIEQSLDVDFDVLCSDLAPMDMLIQRAGRCHRHTREYRPEGFATPRMLVFMPDPETGLDAQWYARAFPIGRHVYRNVAVLWRTARLLHMYKALHLPDNARDLVEGAYGATGHPDLALPQAIETVSIAAEGEQAGARNLGHYNALAYTKGYAADSSDNKWDSDIHTPTRYGEPSVALRLICNMAAGLRLWAGKETQPQTLAMKLCIGSEVKVSCRRAQSSPCPQDCKRPLAALLEQMPDKGKWCIPVVLCQTPEGQWRGEVLADDRRQTVVYNLRNGLQFL